ncbi:MAG: pyridoxamine 5'-phosphate oxidase family protein, partial [Chloroflexota bacterium]
MAKFFESIGPNIQEFIHAQHMFFVASAPLDGSGHVNVSPKGLDSFRILGENKVAYMDLTGSGNETSAHIAEPENGRITIMFCAFDGPPNIVRLFGKGRVVLSVDAEWDSLIANFTPQLGTRQIIVVDVHMVQTSCGYAVPFMDFVGDRETLTKWTQAKSEEELV